ncbi:hypothetical protein P171DRAFT_506960 [Karstenula rhodostoma CBS 690.94]|uniref:Uncharacterized protein n=1 Tax=Karstenula rhodostoma CBS 690.94 TaxID=1392251 RepID=A0A9P4PUV8_9PLEO|nr:hypothetical protein P171DRAFT_506960 [Karstenula rhodostoma CBS 690.94]
MSSSAPTSPARRKSGSVGGAPSPERRRSSRLSSTKSAHEEQVEPAQAADDSDVEDGDANKPAAQDAEQGKRAQSTLSTKFTPNPWHWGEIPHTTRRVYLTSSENEEYDDYLKKKEDGKKDGENDTDEDEDEDGSKDEDDDDDKEESKKRKKFKDIWIDDHGKRYIKVTDPLPSFNGQPPARTSNAQAVPVIHEERGIKFRPDDRYLNGPDGTRIDQQDHLILKLVDMRPKSQTDRTPKRQLVIWFYKNGAPTDWTDKYAIKKLNAAHQDNIRTICHEFTWSQSEANYIAERFRLNRDISMRELAYEFNNRFMGDLPFSPAQGWDQVHTGRTIEAIRGEYLSHKDLYDNGEAPHKSEVRDKKFIHSNGLSEAQLEKNWLDEQKGRRKTVAKTENKKAKDNAKGKTDSKYSAKGGKKDDQENLPVIRHVDGYDRCTIAELKALAKRDKPARFLRGCKKREDYIKRFKEDFKDPSSRSDTGEGEGEGDSDDDAGDDAGDDSSNDDEREADDALDDDVKVPLYQSGPKKGQPYYNSMSANDIKQLAANRNVRFGLLGTVGSAKPTKANYIQALLDDDERKGRYKKARVSTLSKKRKAPSSTVQNNRKKQKIKQSKDADDAGEDDAPSSSKRNSTARSEGPVSPRKASLRSQSNPATEEDEERVNGVEEEEDSDEEDGEESEEP